MIFNGLNNQLINESIWNIIGNIEMAEFWLKDNIWLKNELMTVLGVDTRMCIPSPIRRVWLAGIQIPRPSPTACKVSSLFTNFKTLSIASLFFSNI